MYHFFSLSEDRHPLGTYAFSSSMKTDVRQRQGSFLTFLMIFLDVPFFRLRIDNACIGQSIRKGERET